MLMYSRTIDAIARVSGLKFEHVTFSNGMPYFYFKTGKIYLFLEVVGDKFKLSLFEDFNILGTNTATIDNLLYIIYSFMNNISVKNENVYNLINKLKDDSLYLHKRKGTVYDLVITTNDEVEDETYIETCSYVDVLTGKKYSRTSKEFFEKFIKFGV